MAELSFDMFPDAGGEQNPARVTPDELISGGERIGARTVTDGIITPSTFIEPDEETAPKRKTKDGRLTFESFPDAKRTTTEQLRTVGKSATGAALETAPLLAGALIGAKAGAPVFPPFGSAAGLLLGGGAGLIAGQEIREFAEEFNVPGIGLIANPPAFNLPEEERTAAFAGEVLGGAPGFALAPLRFAATGARLAPSFIGNIINKGIETAGRSPKSFLAVEAFGTVGAATGAGVAQSEFPDQPVVRTGAEVAGGLFNPSKLIVGGASFGVKQARRAAQAFSQSSRQSAAGRTIATILEEAGDDPKVIADMLEQSGLTGVEGLTAAQKTGNRALSELEAKIANSSAKFGAEAKRSAEEGLDAIAKMITALKGTGDPAALQAAAELTSTRYKTLLSSRVFLAEGDVAAAASKIQKDTPAARAHLSKTANEALGNALSDSRKVESALWEGIPVGVPSQSTNIVDRVNNIKGEFLPEEKLPTVIEGFLKRMEESGGVTSTDELIKLRKRALALARQADAKGDFNDARVYGAVAEAALDDLDAVFKGPNQAALLEAGIDVGAYDAARSFSRELHETFTQTFAGQALSTGARGADRIPPELMLKRATSAGPEATALRLRELEEATKFLPTRDLGSEEAIAGHNVMMDAQERILRLSAADSIDPLTGKLDPKKLQKFISQNEELMDRFPQAAEDLKKAVKSQTALTDIENATKGATRAIEEKTAFAKVVDIGNPVIAIERIIKGKNPIKELEQLSKLATKAGPNEVAGLQASIWDHALTKATSPTGDISMARFKGALFNPIRPGEPSLMNVMVKNKIISKEQAAKTEELFGEINKILISMEATGGIDGLIDAPGALVDLVASVAGSRFSTMFTRGQGMAGASLIAAGRGASAARNMFSKVPAAKQFLIIQEAAKNPEFMAMLLRKTSSQKEAIELNRSIHSYLWQAGLLDAEELQQ